MQSDFPGMAPGSLQCGTVRHRGPTLSAAAGANVIESLFAGYSTVLGC